MKRSYPAITPEVFRSVVAFAAADGDGAEPLPSTGPEPHCANCVPFDYRAHFDKP